MINKKLLTIVTTIAILSASTSFAKTEGTYVGVDISRYNVAVKGDGDYARNDQISPAFGVNAKYAINFNNVFIAPGVFADFNNTKEKDGDNTYSTKLSVKNRYGIKADLGYDITNDFAVYATGGFAIVKTAFQYSDNTPSSYKSSHYRSGAVYGAGLAYNYSKNVTFNVEYNTQLIKAKFEPFGFEEKYRINALKLGASYHF